MRILLLNPPVPEKSIGREGRCSATMPIKSHVFPPMSLMYPAAVLKKEGHIVTLFDGVVESMPIVSQLVNKNSLVVINVAQSTIENDLELAREIKCHKPGIHLSCIGIMPTVLPERFLDWFDSVIRKETEKTIEELVIALESNKSLSEINGLSYMKEGRIIHNPDREFLANLDSLPFLARELIDNSKYRFPFTNKKYTTVVVNRGCPFPCNFCTAHLMTGKKLRMRSAENVLEEIKEAISKYGIKHIALYGETVTLNKGFINNFCERIERENIKFKWMCNSRIDTVNENMLKRMFKNGCQYLMFGIESGSQEILDLAGKNIRIEKIKEIILLARRIGFEITTYFMIGLFGETKKTAQQTIDFAVSLDSDYCYFSAATPFEGTEFYDVMRKAGNITESQIKDQLNVVVKSNDLSSEDIEDLIKQAYKKFYLRLPVFIRELKKVVFHGQVFEIKMGIDVVIWLISNSLNQLIKKNWFNKFSSFMSHISKFLSVKQ
jgi:anaerobic magnesium-protoporphyrin IX monomethyl ester cyclase